MTTKNNFLPNTFKMHVFELHVKFASFWITHTQTNALYVIRHHTVNEADKISALSYYSIVYY